MTAETMEPELRAAAPALTVTIRPGGPAGSIPLGADAWDSDTGASPVQSTRTATPVHADRPADTGGVEVVQTGDGDRPTPEKTPVRNRLLGRNRRTSPVRDTTPSPVRDTSGAPATPARPAVTTPSAPVPAVRAGVARKRTTKATPDAPVTLSEQWGKLTDDRRPGVVLALRILAIMITVGLVGVVIAPPALSAKDIIAWAQHTGVDSGLGLSASWAWITFLALDFAAAVSVLICVYAAIVNTKPGVFGLFVWLFAAATAYANYSFGSRPGAPGDAIWFFPAMSLIGPVMLHGVLAFLRKRVTGAAGGARGRRPVFPLSDWNPFTGSTQDTFGAWKTGGLLGLETPDAAMWAYRAISLDAGWISRWRVKKLVRTAQNTALRTKLADDTVAMAIPGLIPDGAFVSLFDDTSDTGDDTTGATPATRRPTPAKRAAVTGAPTGNTSDTDDTTAPVPNTGDDTDTGAPDTGDDDTGDDAEVLQMDTAVHAKHRETLVKIYLAYGSRYASWDEVRWARLQNTLERDHKISKRRSGAALKHAEQVLPWAEADAAARSSASA